jgi:hypothetical protein
MQLDDSIKIYRKKFHEMHEIVSEIHKNRNLSTALKWLKQNQSSASIKIAQQIENIQWKMHKLLFITLLLKGTNKERESDRFDVDF